MSGSGAGWKFRQPTRASSISGGRIRFQNRNESTRSTSSSEPASISAYSSSSVASAQPEPLGGQVEALGLVLVARRARAPPRPPPRAPAHQALQRADGRALVLAHEDRPHASSSYSSRVRRADLVPRVGAGGRGARALPPAPRGPPGRPPAAAERVAQRGGVLGRHQLRRAVHAADLGEAADVGEHHRLAEGQRRVEHARLVDPAVGQHHHVGAAEERRDLGVGHEAVDEADRAAGALAPPPSAARWASTAARRSTARRPRIPRRPRISTSTPLYGRSTPNQRITGPSTAASSSRERLPRAPGG